MPDSKTARKIYYDITEDGRMNLDRASLGLAFSGFVAGLNISFGAMAMFSVAATTGGVGLTAMAIYPLGFLIVVLGRAQLFTETTVIPVTVVLQEKKQKRKYLFNLLRLWGVVLSANILGALVAAAALSFTQVLDSRAFALLLGEVKHKMESGFIEIALFAVYGGWVVALMAWLVAAAQDTIGRAFVIWVTAILIPAGALPHSVAGSAEVLVGVFAGKVLVVEYFWEFLIPVVLGNTIGGVFLVSILNYGQVVGSDKETPLIGDPDEKPENEENEKKRTFSDGRNKDNER
jgi:formate/nitrite transporter FocA (FNT family)